MTAMKHTPAISLVAYEAWPDGKVFVRVPGERGRYMLTDRCVVEVPCPHCNSIKGEPCKSDSLYKVGTHWRRKSNGTSKRSAKKRPRAKPILRTCDVLA